MYLLLTNRQTGACVFITYQSADRRVRICYLPIGRQALAYLSLTNRQTGGLWCYARVIFGRRYDPYTVFTKQRTARPGLLPVAIITLKRAVITTWARCVYIQIWNTIRTIPFWKYSKLALLRQLENQTIPLLRPGPSCQSVVSLTSSLRVISLTVLVDSIHNILIFFAEKMWVAFALQKLLTFFQQKISAYLRITGCKF